jgi:protein NrfD
MNFWVEDPRWEWWIVSYFILGGLGAGCYFMATLIDLMGSDEDRDLARIGYWLAFPLILVCGLLLILDLHRPVAFWHMLARSEVAEQAWNDGWPTTGLGWKAALGVPLMKPWSPMSIGSWALSVFGLCSGLSFLGSLWPDGMLSRILRRGIVGRALQVVGCLAGMFVAAYTGTLLSATNQPMWSDTVWIGALFLTSSASMSIAVMLLIARWRGMANAGSLERLERADLWALGLEIVVFAVFLASLGAFLPAVLETWNGKVLIFGTLLVGLIVPLAIHLRIGGSLRWSMPAAAVCALLGGVILRYTMVRTSSELLVRGPSVAAAYSPEDGRKTGSRGADPGNRGTELAPRSKLAQP